MRTMVIGALLACLASGACKKHPDATRDGTVLAEWRHRALAQVPDHPLRTMDAIVDYEPHGGGTFSIAVHGAFDKIEKQTEYGIQTYDATVTARLTLVKSSRARKLTAECKDDKLELVGRHHPSFHMRCFVQIVDNGAHNDGISIELGPDIEVLASDGMKVHQGAR
ncbi:MAG: hypothetical protein JWP87_515 [Labilithrix sp.]|nr:hypothetical protein [Labilithrix sp.]